MVVLVVRIVFILLGMAGGRELAELIVNQWLLQYPTYQLPVRSATILGCALLGFVLGGAAGRYAAKLLNRFEHALQRVSAIEIAFGLAGILAGFLVAFLPSIVLFRTYPGWIIALMLFALCGVLGYVIAVSKKDDLLDAFRLSRRGPELAGAPRERPRTKILDTSAIIDGRIADICATGFIEGQLLVPRFVLSELQLIADSGDSLKRGRGRRGLDVLNELRRQEQVEVIVDEQDFSEFADVDAKLVKLGKLLNAPLITNDYNLNKIAELQGVAVLNINDLSSALKPVVLPGESLMLRILREGKEAGQGVGYLEDGTMVVVEAGKPEVGQDVRVVVTSVIQTPAGRMVFAALRERAD
ncbi:MAG: PIN domain-containing protein [Candidatus Geothermincolia bacterium]